MENDIPDHIKAHKYCSKNKQSVLKSEICGCFHCLAIFSPKDIYEWIGPMDDSENATSMCPKCEIDSVIGSESGFPINMEFLKAMKLHWFDTPIPNP